MSAANSMQFNQLIGGAIAPSVISQQNGTATNNAAPMAAAAGSQLQGGAAVPNLMIGDYVHGNLGNVITTPYQQPQQ